MLTFLKSKIITKEERVLGCPSSFTSEVCELIQLQKKLGYRVLNIDASLLELGQMKIEKVFENMIKTAFKFSDR